MADRVNDNGPTGKDLQDNSALVAAAPEDDCASKIEPELMGMGGLPFDWCVPTFLFLRGCVIWRLWNRDCGVAYHVTSDTIIEHRTTLRNILRWMFTCRKSAFDI